MGNCYVVIPSTNAMEMIFSSRQTPLEDNASPPTAYLPTAYHLLTPNTAKPDSNNRSHSTNPSKLHNIDFNTERLGK